jgi:hypothetical protein
MFQSATDHQGAHLFLLKITELKMRVFIRGDVISGSITCFVFTWCLVW